MKKFKLGILLMLCVFLITGGVYATWVYNLKVNVQYSDMNNLGSEVSAKEIYGGGNIIIAPLNGFVITIDQKDAQYHACAKVNYKLKNMAKNDIGIEYQFGKEEKRTEDPVTFSWYITVSCEQGKSLDDLVDGKTTSPEKLFNSYQTKESSVTLNVVYVKDSIDHKEGGISLTEISESLNEIINPNFTLDTIEAYENFTKIKWDVIKPKFTLHIM